MQLEHSLRSLKNLILTVKAKYFHQLLVVCLFVFFLIVKSAEALTEVLHLKFFGRSSRLIYFTIFYWKCSVPAWYSNLHKYQFWLFNCCHHAFHRALNIVILIKCILHRINIDTTCPGLLKSSIDQGVLVLQLLLGLSHFPTSEVLKSAIQWS